MPSSIINSDDGVISGTSGLKTTGGNDGVLVFQSKGTETARINTDSQVVHALGTASLPTVSFTGDLNTGLFSPTADTAAITTGGSERMRIDSSGNVGIGASTVRGRLTVSDGAVNTAGEAVYQAYIAGTSRTPTSDITAMLTIQSTNALAANVGGSIAFGGRAVSGSDAGANWATIAGFKETATTSEYGGYLQFSTRPNSGSFAERMRINSDGTIKTVSTISVGGATPSTSGTGITFPATQSASTDANTLDDYEEGTWTPNQGGGLTVVGTFSSSGEYTKIGRMVFIRGQVSGSTSVAISAGGTMLTNLPFNAVGDNSGSCFNANLNSSGVIDAYTNLIYSSNTITASGAIFFAAVYNT